MTTKNGDRAATPFQPSGPDGLPSYEAEYGFTKREMMAMHIASGFASDQQVAVCNIATLAVEVADKLLAELDRTK